MQIHPSTKKLIDRLYDMTLERKIAWKQGADGAVVYDTERYRVSLVGTPTEVILSSDTGAELDKADHEELRNTLLEDGTTYAEYVGQLHKEAHRIARGAESAIDDVLAALDETDEDNVLASVATATTQMLGAAVPVAEKTLEMPESTGDTEEAISEPASEELSSEQVADAVATMAKTVNSETSADSDAAQETPERELAAEPTASLVPPHGQSEPEPIADASTSELGSDTTPEPISTQPPDDPQPSPSPPRPQITGGGFGFGSLGQTGLSSPPTQSPPEPAEPEPPVEEPVTAAPQPDVPTPAAPPAPAATLAGEPSRQDEKKEEPPVASEPVADETITPAPAPPPPLTGGGYSPSPFGITTQRPPAQTPAQPAPADETPAPETADAAAETKPPQPTSTLGMPSLGVPRATAPPAPIPAAPELPDMGPGVEESKIANLVGSITETVDDADAEPEELTTVPSAGVNVPAAVTGIADAASPAIKKASEIASPGSEGASETLKERSIGVIDETGDIIRKETEPEPDETPSDKEMPEPPKPPSKRFNPWR